MFERKDDGGDVLASAADDVDAGDVHDVFYAWYLLYLGHEAVDTRSNAEETARWLRDHRYRSVRLVTADWHMPRARFELSRALNDGPAVAILADPVRSAPGFAMLFAEYNKYVLRRLAVPLGI